MGSNPRAMNGRSIIDEMQVNQSSIGKIGSLRGNYPSTHHNPLLSVSHERNTTFQNGPPILLQAHTLNNASRLASSRRFLNDEATGDEQSPMTTPERVRVLPPQVFTSEATGLTPSAAD